MTATDEKLLRPEDVRRARGPRPPIVGPDRQVWIRPDRRAGKKNQSYDCINYAHRICTRYGLTIRDGAPHPRVLLSFSLSNRCFYTKPTTFDDDNGFPLRVTLKPTEGQVATSAAYVRLPVGHIFGIVFTETVECFVTLEHGRIVARIPDKWFLQLAGSSITPLRSA